MAVLGQQLTHMPFESQIICHLDQGMVLDIELEGLSFRAYVAMRSADVEEVAALVPPEQFDSDTDIHVAAIHDGDDVRDEIQDVMFNLNPGDVMVFLCTGTQAYVETLAELGQKPLTAA